jgi:ubiquinone/menaquinone biosynthesis C-methylase UbiE
MDIDYTKIIFPTISDYPEEMFDITSPKGYRVGCARAYLESNIIAKRFFMRRIKEAFRLLPQRDYESVADIGTGAGFYLPLLASIGKQIHAVDIAPVLDLTHKMICKKGLQNISFYKSDVSSLPFKSGYFDLMFCLSLIEHIEDQQRTLIEFNRIIKAGGILILGYPLQNIPQNIFEEANRNLQFARLLFKLGITNAIKKRRESKFYAHDHVSDFKNIKQKAERCFSLVDSTVIRLLGFPVYEILLLIQQKSA